MVFLKWKWALTACAVLLTVNPARSQYLAYIDTSGPGNQAWTGNLGLDFTVNSPILVTSLCAYNGTATGFAAGTTISVGIYTNPGGVLVAGPVSISGGSFPLAPTSLDRCAAISPFVNLPPGAYSVVAVGFNANDKNGNQGVSSVPPPPIESTGNGLISFTGYRFDSNTKLGFPATGGGVPPTNIFNAGSFQFIALPPTIQKTFGAPDVDINQATTLTFNLSNANGVPLTGVSFTDTLPAGLKVASPNGLTAVLCGGNPALGASVTALPGGSVVSLSGAQLTALANCSFSVNVIGVSDGAFTNTTSTITANESGTGLAATAPITVNPVIDGAGIYQLRYLANLDKGDSFVNLTNAGTVSGYDPAGRICVNVYTFGPAEALISCCACPLTPNSVSALSAQYDLISNTLTLGVPTSVTVKLISTIPDAGGSCNASSPIPQTVVRGMRAWATTLHYNTTGSPPIGYQHTETPFSYAELSVTELSKITQYCGFIQANGSGYGICKSCRNNALGTEQR